MNTRFLFLLSTDLTISSEIGEKYKVLKTFAIRITFQRKLQKNCENYLLYFLHDLSVFIQSKKIILESQTACI